MVSLNERQYSVVSCLHTLESFKLLLPSSHHLLDVGIPQFGDVHTHILPQVLMSIFASSSPPSSSEIQLIYIGDQILLPITTNDLGSTAIEFGQKPLGNQFVNSTAIKAHACNRVLGLLGALTGLSEITSAKTRLVPFLKLYRRSNLTH